MHAIRIRSLVMIASLVLSHMAIAQMPQPMRDANFARTLPPSGFYPVQSGGVYPAQYQRYGKRSYTQRRPSGSSSSKSLVGRLLQPREEEGPKIDYSKYSVSGSQPPLQNYRPGAKPAQQAQSVPPRNTSPSTSATIRRQTDSDAQAGSRQTGVGQPPVPTLKDATAPVYTRDSLPPRTSVRRSEKNAQNKELKPVPSGLFPESTAPQVAKRRLPKSGTPSQSAEDNSETTSARMTKDQLTARGDIATEQQAPKVTRVPLPAAKDASPSGEEVVSSKQNVQTQEPATASETKNDLNGAKKPSAAELSNKDTGSLPNSVQGAKPEDQKLAKGGDDNPVNPNKGADKKIQSSTEKPKIPSQLVGSRSAAEENAKSKISAQYMTAPQASKLRGSPTSLPTARPSTVAKSSPSSKTSLEPPALPKLDKGLGESQQTLPGSADTSSGQPSVQRLPLPQMQKATQESKTTNPVASSLPKALPKSLPKTVSVPTATQPLTQKPAGLPTSKQPSSVKPKEASASLAPTQVELPKPVESQSNLNSRSLTLTPNPTPSGSLPSLDMEVGTPPKPQELTSQAPTAIRPKMDLKVPLPQQTNELPSLPTPTKSEFSSEKNLDPRDVVSGRNSLPNALPQPPTLVKPSPVAVRSNSVKNQLRSPFGLPDKGAFPVAASARLNMQAPSLQVLLNGPETVPVASPVDYEVVAINRDSVDLNGLILRLEIPAGVVVQSIDKQAAFDVEKAPNGATLLTWGVENLSANDEIRAKLTIATRKATDFSIGLDWTLMPISEQAAVRVIAPSLSTEVIGPRDVVFGQSNTYRLRVKNSGEAAAENVNLQVMVPSLGTHRAELGTLAPGQEATREFEIAFQQQGTVDFQALATASNNLRAPSDSQIQVRRQRVVAQMSAPQLVYHGHAVAYRVVLSNKGDAQSKTCKGRLSLPTGAKPVALPYGATMANNALVWDIAPISPGQAVEYDFQLRLSGDGQHVVSFECPDDVGNAIVATSSTVLQSIADLMLIVSDPVAPAPVDSEVGYELTLTNRGSKAASNVRVIGQFSKGIEPTRATGAKYKLVPGQVFFDAIPSIGAGDSVKLKIYATATADGMHRFRAEVRSDTDASRLVQEESTQFMKTNTRIAAPPVNASPLR